MTSLQNVLSLQSDMYSLGIILFELYNNFSTGMERSKAITTLREESQLSEEFKESVKGFRPDIGALVLRLTSRSSSERPTSTMLLQTTFTKDNSEQIKRDEENQMLRRELEAKDETINRLHSRIKDLEYQLRSQNN